MMGKRTNTLKDIVIHNSNRKNETNISEINLENINVEDNTHSLHLKNNKGLDLCPSEGTKDVLNLVMPIQAATQAIGLDPEDLKIWLSFYPMVSTAVQLSLLRLMVHYRIDPYLEEVTFSQYDNASWGAMITISGWASISNRCSAYSGVSFSQAPEENAEGAAPVEGMRHL